MWYGICMDEAEPLRYIEVNGKFYVEVDQITRKMRWIGHPVMETFANKIEYIIFQDVLRRRK